MRLRQVSSRNLGRDYADLCRSAECAQTAFAVTEACRLALLNEMARLAGVNIHLGVEGGGACGRRIENPSMCK